MREVKVPAQTVREVVRSLQEYPPVGTTTPGIITCVVALVDANGEFIPQQPAQAIEITGADYDELCGPPTEDYPTKPAGTYRNDDLWYFIDRIRERMAKEKEEETIALAAAEKRERDFQEAKK